MLSLKLKRFSLRPENFSPSFGDRTALNASAQHLIKLAGPRSNLKAALHLAWVHQESGNLMTWPHEMAETTQDLF